MDCRGRRHRYSISYRWTYITSTRYRQIFHQHQFFTYSYKRGKLQLYLSRMKERRTLETSWAQIGDLIILFTLKNSDVMIVVILFRWIDWCPKLLSLAYIHSLTRPTRRRFFIQTSFSLEKEGELIAPRTSRKAKASQNWHIEYINPIQTLSDLISCFD